MPIHQRSPVLQDKQMELYCRQNAWNNKYSSCSTMLNIVYNLLSFQPILLLY